MPDLLKISQLASQAGVEKSTVQHYIRKGLLPKPVDKPHRNMAYYSSDLVERIRLIKELQGRYYLPLDRIKAMLDDHAGLAEIRGFLGEKQFAIPSEPADRITRADLLRETGLSSEDLTRLEEEGFVLADGSGDDAVYRGSDVAIVQAVASMQRAGLNRDNGFLVEDMKIYLDTTRELIGQEVALFTKVMGRLPRADVIAMARAGLEGTNRLLIALRRKVFLDLLGEMGVGEMPAPGPR